jgi:hypothetical protein
MITADQVQRMMELNRWDLAGILAHSGYSGQSFESAKFVGITESGDFCYAVTYYDEALDGEIGAAWVYVRREKATGQLTAEF